MGHGEKQNKTNIQIKEYKIIGEQRSGLKQVKSEFLIKRQERGK